MWNNFKKGWREFWRIFRLEFKVNFGGHRLKMLKFLGILVIPFLYGFIYICAMWNPLGDTRPVDITFVVSQDMAKKGSDPAYDAMRTHMHKRNPHLSVPFHEAVIPSKDLYNKTNTYDKEINKHNVSIVINPIYKKDINGKVDKSKVMNLTEYIGGMFAHALNYKHNASSQHIRLIDLINKNPNLFTMTLASEAIVSGANDYTTPFDVYFNYKKNFVLGFGTNNKISGSDTVFKLLDAVMTSKQSSLTPAFPAIIAAAQKEYAKLSGLPLVQVQADVKNAVTKLQAKAASKHKILDPHIFANKYQGQGKIEKYGFGIAALFICVGLWIGTLSTTFMVTPKTHERGTSKVKAFFAKLGLIWIANILQVSILMGALTLLGFSSLGPSLPILFVVGFFVSFLFSAIVFSIRCMVPAKVTGIFIVTIFFIIQVTASGGLFPMYTQSVFFKILHVITPFTYSVNAFRETLFEPSAVEIVMNLVTLTLLAIPFVFFGALTYKRRKEKHELENPNAFLTVDKEKQNEIKEIESPLHLRIKKMFKKDKKEDSDIKKETIHSTRVPKTVAPTEVVKLHKKKKPFFKRKKSPKSKFEKKEVE